MPVDGSYVTDVLPTMVLFGAGAGLSFPSLMTLAMSGVDPRESGLASGLVDTPLQVGGAIGLAVLATLATSRSETLVAAGEPPRRRSPAATTSPSSWAAAWWLWRCSWRRPSCAPRRPRPPNAKNVPAGRCRLRELRVRRLPPGDLHGDQEIEHVGDAAQVAAGALLDALEPVVRGVDVREPAVGRDAHVEIGGDVLEQRPDRLRHEPLRRLAAEKSVRKSNARSVAKRRYRRVNAARELHPGTLALRSPIPVELEVRTRERFPEPIEVAAYYIGSEALANAAKHSQASRITDELGFGDEKLRLSIRDDGIGGADPGRGSGLTGLRDRMEALGGTLTVESGSGAGTSLSATLPFGDDLGDHA